MSLIISSSNYLSNLPYLFSLSFLVLIFIFLSIFSFSIQAELQASDSNSKPAGTLFLSVVFLSLSFVIGFTLVTIVEPTAWG